MIKITMHLIDESNKIRKEASLRPLNNNFQSILRYERKLEECLAWALRLINENDLNHIEYELLQIESEIASDPREFRASSIFSSTSDSLSDDDTIGNSRVSETTTNDTDLQSKIKLALAMKPEKVDKDARVRLDAKLNKLGKSLMDNLIFRASKSANRRRVVEITIDPLILTSTITEKNASPTSSGKTKDVAATHNLESEINNEEVFRRGAIKVSESPIFPSRPSQNRRTLFVKDKSPFASKLASKKPMESTTSFDSDSNESSAKSEEIRTFAPSFVLKPHPPQSVNARRIKTSTNIPRVTNPETHDQVIEQDSESIMKSVRARRLEKISLINDFQSREEAAKKSRAIKAASLITSPSDDSDDLTAPFIAPESSITSRYISSPYHSLTKKLLPVEESKQATRARGELSPEKLHSVVDLPELSLLVAMHELEEKRKKDEEDRRRREPKMTTAGKLAIYFGRSVEVQTDALRRMTAEATSKCKDSLEKFSESLKSFEETKRNMAKITRQSMDERKLHLSSKLRRRRQELRDDEMPSIIPCPPVSMLRSQQGGKEGQERTDAVSLQGEGVFLTQPMNMSTASPRSNVPTKFKESQSPRPDLMPNSARLCGYQIDMMSKRQTEIERQENLMRIRSQSWYCELLVKLRAIKTRLETTGSVIPRSVLRLLHAMKTLIILDTQLSRDIILTLLDSCVDNTEYVLSIVYDFVRSSCKVFGVSAVELYERINDRRILPNPRLLADMKKEIQEEKYKS